MTAIATHWSSPADGYTPCGDACGMGVAERRGVDAGACGLEVHLADEVGGGLGLRELEVLALARRLSFGERGEHADGEQAAGDVVGVVHRRAARIRRVGVVPQQVHAAEAGVERSVGGHLAERAAAPVALRRRVDDTRVARRARRRSRGPRRSSAPPRWFSATTSADAHSASASSRPRSVLRSRATLRRPRHSSLNVKLLSISSMLPLPMRSTSRLAMRLDLDHVGAELREDARTSRARPRRRRTRSTRTPSRRQLAAVPERAPRDDASDANVGASSTDARRGGSTTACAPSFTGCVANGSPSRPSTPVSAKNSRCAGLRVRDELARLVEHAHRGAVAERFVEELGPGAVGEALLRHHPDDVGVHRAGTAGCATRRPRRRRGCA